MSIIILIDSATVFADTYINKDFKDGYGKYMLDVNSLSGMRSCEARAWGSDNYNYKYKIELTTVLYDGQEVTKNIFINYLLLKSLL
ncbi:MAG: hypothetical protein HFJ03_06450 [Lachnospira sp.]|jgi:hypothetical protein|nr:hypothetical protein [Lachnospira sp.]